MKRLAKFDQEVVKILAINPLGWSPHFIATSSFYMVVWGNLTFSRKEC